VAAFFAEGSDEDAGRRVDDFVDQREIVRRIHITADHQQPLDPRWITADRLEQHGEQVPRRAFGGALPGGEVEISANFAGDELAIFGRANRRQCDEAGADGKGRIQPDRTRRLVLHR